VTWPVSCVFLEDESTAVPLFWDPTLDIVVQFEEIWSSTKFSGFDLLTLFIRHMSCTQTMQIIKKDQDKKDEFIKITSQIARGRYTHT
jgi:hypothetical protein